MVFSNQTIEGKYATALFRAASRLNAFKQVEADIFRLKDMFAGTEGTRLSSLLASPLMNNSQKQRLISPLITKLTSNNVNSTVYKFIELIANNGRLSKLTDIVNSFAKICESQKQVSIVNVASAKVQTCILILGAVENGTGSPDFSDK